MKNQIKFYLITVLLCSFVLCSALLGFEGNKNMPESIGKIVLFDPEFEKIIPKNSKIEVLAGGFDWAEGPVLIPEKATILFSDLPNNIILSWKEGVGVNIFMEQSGYTGTEKFKGDGPGSNGLMLDSKGTLYICCHGDRCIKKLIDGKPVVVVDKFDGKRLNSPNDLVFHENGDLYFTDPPYGLHKQIDDPAKELDWSGVYRYSNGKLTLLTKELTLPNGLAFSPDYKTLYVSQSDYSAPLIKSFPVKEDGTLGKSSIFIDVDGWGVKDKGAPDGMVVDEQGRIWTTGPGGVLVYNKNGKLLAQLNTGGEQASNCIFDKEGYLYITTGKHLCRVKINLK